MKRERKHSGRPEGGGWLDPETVERVESELDQFVERRAREARDAGQRGHPRTARREARQGGLGGGGGR